MKKAIGLLTLYDELKSEEGVKKENFMNETGISLSSFRRYLRNISDYLLPRGYFVRYNRKTAVYRVIAQVKAG